MEAAAAGAAWVLLMLFFSLIHGYSVGREAGRGGPEPVRARFERPWRGWTLGLGPGTLCSKGGGISVDRESAELLIDEL